MTSHVQTVTFAQLIASDAINARLTGQKDGLEELAASILAKGLIQPLAVRPADSGASGKGAPRYEIIDGTAYPVLASESKSYRSDLERFGGKAAVFADDFNRWFAGLWMGKRLAYTVGVLSIGVALMFFRAAHNSSKRQSARQDGGTS